MNRQPGSEQAGLPSRAVLYGQITDWRGLLSWNAHGQAPVSLALTDDALRVTFDERLLRTRKARWMVDGLFKLLGSQAGTSADIPLRGVKFNFPSRLASNSFNFELADPSKPQLINKQVFTVAFDGSEAPETGGGFLGRRRRKKAAARAAREAWRRAIEAKVRDD